MGGDISILWGSFLVYYDGYDNKKVCGEELYIKVMGVIVVIMYCGFFYCVKVEKS